MDSSCWPYLLIVVLLCFSAFFSGSEIAYASANRLRLRKAAESGSIRAQLAYSICVHYNEALCTILIGNNLVNIAASSVATVIAIALAGESGAVYASAVMTVLILIFGEILPKILAKQYCDRVVPLIAYPLKFLMTVTRPAVKLVLSLMNRIAARFGGGAQEDAAMTADELSLIIDAVQGEGVIDEDRSDLLQSALEFGDTTVDEILTPRVDVLMLDAASTPEEVLAVAKASPHSRIPVYEEDADHIIGVLYLNHYFKRVAEGNTLPLGQQLYAPCYLHRSATLPVALSALRRQQIYLAVVVDEYGGTCGILTMEDILEELVGEIWDETDQVTQEFQSLPDGSFRVLGSMNVYDMLEALDLDPRIYNGDSTTAGGWAGELLGELPESGDTFSFQNIAAMVEKTEDLRVFSLILKKMQK